MNRPQLLLATGNPHKAKEVQLLLGRVPLRLMTLKDFPGTPEVAEDGATLEANARKKALSGAAYTGLWTLADDTGLEVEALGGQPGVHSARYAGPECDFEQNNRKLLAELADVKGEKRRARFRCVMALAHPSGQVLLKEGFVDGLITETYAGDEGFGYDPVFYIPELKRTLGEMPLKEKCKVSHRFRAIEAIRADILDVLHLEAPHGRR
jgi:XTP/dITP diphosphohydrolase